MDIVCFRGIGLFYQRQAMVFPRRNLLTVLKRILNLIHELGVDMIHYNTCTVSQRYDTLHVLYCTDPDPYLHGSVPPPPPKKSSGVVKYHLRLEMKEPFIWHSNWQVICPVHLTKMEHQQGICLN